MQCGSRFSVIRCVKTYRLETTSLSTMEFFQLRTVASGLPRMRDMQTSQTQAILLNCYGVKEFHFPRGTSRPCGAYRSWATILGYDQVTGARALITLKMRTSSSQTAWQ